MQSECHTYLDTLETMHILHLRDLATGKKRRIKCVDVKIHVPPQFEGLRVEDMLEFAKNYPAVAQALPDDRKEIDKLHRDYVSNVIYTLVGQPYITWCDARVAARNQEVELKQDLNAQLDPEIAQILQASRSISTCNGVSNALMKVSNH